jgi:hypothetical protein
MDSRALNAVLPQAMDKTIVIWYGIGDALGLIGSYAYDFSFS